MLCIQHTYVWNSHNNHATIIFLFDWQGNRNMKKLSSLFPRYSASESLRSRSLLWKWPFHYAPSSHVAGIPWEFPFSSWFCLKALMSLPGKYLWCGASEHKVGWEGLRICGTYTMETLAIGFAELSKVHWMCSSFLLLEDWLVTPVGFPLRCVSVTQGPHGSFHFFSFSSFTSFHI